jgi:hypothetical protein
METAGEGARDRDPNFKAGEFGARDRAEPAALEGARLIPICEP